jgi:muramidase (phage lysozyme)
MTRAELLAISRERNVRAMLDVIAACEGTAGAHGYRTVFGGGLIDSLADHPKTVISRTLGGKPIRSSAAGRYQFLARTWARLVRQYGFPDFSPSSQDAGAVALILGRKALADVQAGRLDAAVRKLAPEWASLPGAPYGQPTKSLAFVRRTYAQAGGGLEGEPVPPHPNLHTHAPMRAPEPEPEPERPVAPILAALLPSLVASIPQLAKLFGTGSAVAERNVAAAEAVAKLVVQATGAPNLQGAVESIQADPASRQKAAEAVEGAWYTLVEAGGGGIDGARKFNAALVDLQAWRMPALWVTVALLLPVYAVVGSVLWHPAFAADKDIRLQVVTATLVVISIVASFWLGSSSSSRAKDDALIRSAEK